ncbi:hypothetical protein RO3G_01409 [Rhizopus delemar RA 99-880]|uniref:FAD-binding domain-containing protein n=1 Tax=Rhizopus delemar (strain RA 99-880 / ATCC MYA-4621 / FGSC 9543 / NRRL 43880) TaxID=246409 RepID=I1BKH5_RHIO9|nr:hypothetical protein RO3G_01409 [Rhizopus delemar RA 99-880]|eukprot:EIE76705.1 hypothetical protein RO3G_01409 [Rhizopus delemar RA 99-880]
MTRFKVLIIGGGLSGLMLSNALGNKGVDCEVFERDSDPDSRHQGFSTTFHDGLKALREHLSKDQLQGFGKNVGVDHENNEGGVHFLFFDSQSNLELASFELPAYQGYRVNRKRFRNWLLKGAEKTVRWNKQMSHYEEFEDRVEVIFKDGTRTVGDLLVAADGCMSTIARQLLGDEKFNQLTQINPIHGYACCRWITESEWEQIAKKRNQITVVIGKATDDMVQIRPKVMNTLKSWASSAYEGAYRQLIVGTPDDTPVKRITIREREPVYDLLMSPHRRVVLIGDSAHPMTMFRGNGANQAILDAGSLANEIKNVVSGQKSLSKAVDDYYKEMIPRSRQAVVDSHIAAKVLHTEADEIIRFFENRTRK